MDTDDNERFSDEQFERDQKMIRNILSGSPQTEDIDENCVYLLKQLVMPFEDKHLPILELLLTQDKKFLLLIQNLLKTQNWNFYYDITRSPIIRDRIIVHNIDIFSDKTFFPENHNMVSFVINDLALENFKILIDNKNFFKRFLECIVSEYNKVSYFLDKSRRIIDMMLSHSNINDSDLSTDRYKLLDLIIDESLAEFGNVDYLHSLVESYYKKTRS